MKTKNFGREFFGMGGFTPDTGKNFREEWANMTTEEKVEFINKREEAINSKGQEMGGFDADTMDKFCEEWLNKTPEEKTEFLNKRKEAFQNRSLPMFRFFRHFGFGRDERTYENIKRNKKDNV